MTNNAENYIFGVYDYHTIKNSTILNQQVQKTGSRLFCEGPNCGIKNSSPKAGHKHSFYEGHFTWIERSPICSLIRPQIVIMFATQCLPQGWNKSEQSDVASSRPAIDQRETLQFCVLTSEVSRNRFSSQHQSSRSLNLGHQWFILSSDPLNIQYNLLKL